MSAIDSPTRDVAGMAVMQTQERFGFHVAVVRHTSGVSGVSCDTFSSGAASRCHSFPGMFGPEISLSKQQLTRQGGWIAV